MIEEQGIIVDKKDGKVVLEIERASACTLCGQKRGCGNATWGKLLGHKDDSLELKNTINANVGDLVIVGLEEKLFLNAAFFLYCLPLMTLLIGALLGHWLWGGDLAVMLSATAGLLSGFMITKYLYQLRAQNDMSNGEPSFNHAQLLRLAKHQSDDV